MITNDYKVCGKDVHVVDGLLDPHDLIFIETLMTEIPYTINQVSSRLFAGQNANKGRPACHFEMKDLANNQVILKMCRHINQVKPGYVVEKAYVNYYNLGTTALPHVDKNSDTAESFTALLFVTSQWQLHWGGGFLICSDNDTQDVHVAYKENRMILFDGSLLHCALPLSVLAEKDRFTLAIKFNKG